MTPPRQPIAPFWQRFPQILAYPFHLEVLFPIAMLAVGRMVLNFLPIPGFLVSLVFWIMAFKIAVEALENTARGHLTPGKGGNSWATDGDARDQILLLVLFFFAPLAVGYWISIWAALAVLLVETLVLPAAVALLAIDKSLWYALNPQAWFTLMQRVGMGYVVAVALIWVLQIVVVIANVVLAFAPGFIAVPVGSVITLLALVTGYHLIGYLIYQHHVALGLDLTETIVRPTFANAEEDEAMRQSQVGVDQGDLDAATRPLQTLVMGRGATAPIHDRYRKLLVDLRDGERLCEHGRVYIPQLMAQGQDKRALAIAGECLAYDPAFALTQAEDIVRLVALAAERGQSQVAVRLAHAFDSRFPRSPDIVDVQLTVARLYYDKLGKEAEARVLLDTLAARFPEHPRSEDIRNMQATVNKLLAITEGRPVA